jgi:hypothetical protein
MPGRSPNPPAGNGRSADRSCTDRGVDSRGTAQQPSVISRQGGQADAPLLARVPGSTIPLARQHLPPVPRPGHTPYNFIAESPAVRNWESAAKGFLQKKFRRKTPFRSFADAMGRYQSHLSRLRTHKAKKAFADKTFDAIRDRYYRLEFKNPSFAYSDEEMTNLENPRAPYRGAVIHHPETRTQLPERAIDPYNLVFTEGGGRGSPHDELHRRAVGEKMSSRPPAAVRQAVVPAQGAAPETDTTATDQRGVDANGVPRRSAAVTRGRLGDATAAPDPAGPASGRTVPEVPSPVAPGEIGEAPRVGQPKIVEPGPPAAEPVVARAPAGLRGAGISRGAMLGALGVELAVQFAAAWALQKLLETLWPGFFGQEMVMRSVQTRMLVDRFSDRLQRQMQLLLNDPKVRAQIDRAPASRQFWFEITYESVTRQGPPGGIDSPEQEPHLHDLRLVNVRLVDWPGKNFRLA